MLANADSYALIEALEARVGEASPVSPVWTCLRRDGRVVCGGWTRQRPIREIVSNTVGQAGADTANILELAVPGPFQRFDPADPRPMANVHRGRVSVVFQYGNAYRAVAPTTTIATNRGLQKERDTFLEAHGISLDELRESGTGRIADTTSFLVTTDPGGTLDVRRLYRGNEIVHPEAVTADEAERMLDRLLGWASANQQPDGGLPYKYWPSRGEYADSNNVIRQMLATLGLIRAAHARRDEDLSARAEANLRRNLDAYFVDCGDYGAMECGGKGKLGATALAALCLLEHTGSDGTHTDVLAKLRAGVDRQWQMDGAFRTFFWPVERNDNQNFYPGEALLFYAALYDRTGDPAVLDRAMRSFQYYRDWHRSRPNPAFVPWHTQAYVRLYWATGAPALRDFVFEMNDWLCTLQQWGAPLAPDLWGRFYAPAKPSYGPPHAASTGVYLEGLGDAYALAIEIGDPDRTSRYATALRRGLRSLRQLQVVTATDMFYMAQPQRAWGAIRTEAYDNEIRLDNAGHAMLALLKAIGTNAADSATTQLADA
jgi:hypothetical protein